MENVPLAELLPQSGRMVLLTGYAPPDGDGGVEAFVDIGRLSAFFDDELGGVPACVALEYMAQTMALCVGLRRRRAGAPPKIGFVLGSRRLDLRLDRFLPGERYTVSAKCVYEDESFGSFECSVADADGREVASGTLSAFQLPDGATPEQLREMA